MVNRGNLINRKMAGLKEVVTTIRGIDRLQGQGLDIAPVWTPRHFFQQLPYPSRETALPHTQFLSFLHLFLLPPTPCLTSPQSLYEPGKRHWLKVKKDYLEGGAMADTADLIVLGGYYGTGSKGHCHATHCHEYTTVLTSRYFMGIKFCGN